MTITKLQPANLHGLNQRFAGQTPLAVLQWIRATFGDAAPMGTGFGPSGVVLMHMLMQIDPTATVFYIETDLLFAETKALREQLNERLGITFTVVHSGMSLGTQSAEYGRLLWQRAPDLCCHLRKVIPLHDYLSDKRAWITAIRREQSASRQETPIIGWDAHNQVIKVAPLAGWTKQMVWQYISKHKLPYNRLLDAGYSSIGCKPCTAKSYAGRAGRWAGSGKTECGIHQTILPLQ